MKAAVFGADETRKAEQMNVAGTFGGDEATTAAEPTSKTEIAVSSLRTIRLGCGEAASASSV